MIYILNKFIEALPKKFQKVAYNTIMSIFEIYYTLKHNLPYNKAKGYMAYIKFINSSEYKGLLELYSGNIYKIEDLYYDERLWVNFMKKLTFKEKVKCLLIPYTVISTCTDNYNG